MDCRSSLRLIGGSVAGATLGSFWRSARAAAKFQGGIVPASQGAHKYAPTIGWLKDSSRFLETFSPWRTFSDVIEYYWTVGRVATESQI